MSTDLARFALPVAALPPSATLTDDPYLWSLLALASMAETTLPELPLLGLLTGGCLVQAACDGCCAYWWLGAGKARRRKALGELLGWDMTHVAADGTPEGYEAALKGPVAVELTFGRPVLAYGGWSGRGAYHWGLVTATGEGHQPAGHTVFAPDLEQMAEWPYRVQLIKPEREPRPVTPDDLWDALRDALACWDDAVGEETAAEPLESQWHSGDLAFAMWRDRLAASAPFCLHCPDDDCRQALVTGYAANLARMATGLDAAATLTGIDGLVRLAAECADHSAMVAGAATQAPDAMADLVESWRERHGQLMVRLRSLVPARV